MDQFPWRFRLCLSAENVVRPRSSWRRHRILQSPQHILPKFLRHQVYDKRHWVLEKWKSKQNCRWSSSKIIYSIFICLSVSKVRRIGPQHQAGSDALLTLSTYYKLRTTYLKGVPEQKHSNVLYGIGLHGSEGLSDYVWQNFIVSEYPYMMYNSYGMTNMNPMMSSSYYGQNDAMYSGVNNTQYNMPNMTNMSNMQYNVYNSYGSTPYMEPTQKVKKFGK